MQVLSPEERDQAIETLARDGYVVIRNAVDTEKLADFADHLNAEYERAKHEERLFDGGGSFAGHLNCYPGERSRFIYNAIADRGIIDIVAAHSPDTVDQVRATTNYNLPNSRWQHIHSDGLYTEAFVICNVAVVDTDLQNGAIEIVPGTHRRFYKFWQYVLGRKQQEAIRVSMNQGDALLRISTMWHRGTPNRTDQPRPMMSLTFGETSAPEDDPFAINKGQVTFTPNWYGTDRLSQIQEQVFARVPLVYSTLRFGRSLVGNKGYSSW